MGPVGEANSMTVKISFGVTGQRMSYKRPQRKDNFVTIVTICGAKSRGNHISRTRAIGPHRVDKIVGSVHPKGMEVVQLGRNQHKLGSELSQRGVAHASS